MKRNLSLIITMLALAALACNSLIKLPISGLNAIPTETFYIAEPLPVGEAITNVTLGLAASSARLTVGGGASGLIEGLIQYNVTEWKPTLTRSEGGLYIEQNIPHGTIGGTPDGSLNDWEIKLSDEFKEVHINCSAGNYTLVFMDNLAGYRQFNIEMGTGNLRLLFPAGVSVSVDVNSGPVSIATEGTWTENDNTYTTGNSNPTWVINLQIGVGKLTLASR